MAIGGLIASTTGVLMLAAIPVSTIQVTSANEGSPSSVMTSTEKLTSSALRTLEFDYGRLAIPSVTDVSSSSAVAFPYARTPLGGEAVVPDTQTAETAAASEADASNWKTEAVPTRFLGTFAIERAAWQAHAPSSSRRHRSDAPASTSGRGVLLAGASESNALDALLAPQAQWDAIRNGAGVAYADASFSLAAQSSKEPTLATSIESPSESSTDDRHKDTNVPTPGTLALFALGVAAVIAGARSRSFSPAGLLRR